MTLILRQCVCAACVSLKLLLGAPAVVQAAGWFSSVLAQGGGGAVAKRSNYTFEAIGVVLLFALALFVVCKGSRRV